MAEWITLQWICLSYKRFVYYKSVRTFDVKITHDNFSKLLARRRKYVIIIILKNKEMIHHLSEGAFICTVFSLQTILKVSLQSKVYTSSVTGSHGDSTSFPGRSFKFIVAHCFKTWENLRNNSRGLESMLDKH